MNIGHNLFYYVPADGKDDEITDITSNEFIFRPKPYFGNKYTTKITDFIFQKDYTFPTTITKINTVLFSENNVKNENNRYILNSILADEMHISVYELFYHKSEDDVEITNVFVPITPETISKNVIYDKYIIGKNDQNTTRMYFIPFKNSFKKLSSGNDNDIDVFYTLSGILNKEIIVSNILNINETGFTIILSRVIGNNNYEYTWDSDIEIDYITYRNSITTTPLKTYYNHMPIKSKKMKFIYNNESIKKLVIPYEGKKEVFVIGQITNVNGKEILYSNIGKRDINGIPVYIFNPNQSTNNNNDEIVTEEENEYIFNYLIVPIDAIKYPITTDKQLEITIYKGNIAHEIYMKYTDNYIINYRVYMTADNREFVEMTYENLKVEKNKEIVYHFTTNLNNSGIIESDLNSLSFYKHIRNNQKYISENIAGNYYPSSTSIIMNDGVNAIGIINEISHSISSLSDNEFEILYNRNIDEISEEENSEIFVSTSYLLCSKAESINSLVNKYRTVLFNKPLINYVEYNQTSLPSDFEPDFSIIKGDLSTTLHVVSINTYERSKSILLRLENINYSNDDVVIDLFKSLKIRNIKNIEERDLGGIFSIDTMKKQKKNNIRKGKPIFVNERNYTVTIKPNEIRTFLVEYNI